MPPPSARTTTPSTTRPTGPHVPFWIHNSPDAGQGPASLVRGGREQGRPTNEPHLPHAPGKVMKPPPRQPPLPPLGPFPMQIPFPRCFQLHEESGWSHRNLLLIMGHVSAALGLPAAFTAAVSMPFLGPAARFPTAQFTGGAWRGRNGQ